MDTILFPLTIDSSFPAFPADQETIKIYYKSSNAMATSITSRKIYASIVNQKTNKTALAGGRAKTANLYNTSYSDDNGTYVLIPSSVLEGGAWTQGIYKLQLQYNINQQDSEWSTICYLKVTAPSDEISVEILNVAEGNVVYNNSPVFKGKYVTTDTAETEARYKFDLLNLSGEILETTGWTAHSSENDIDDCVFKAALQDLEEYRVNYYIETKNGYVGQSTFLFSCFFSIYDNPGLKFTRVENNYDEGCIELEIGCDTKLVNNLILRRSDSSTDFGIWEDYRYFQVLDEAPEIFFKDFLVEAGREYQYTIATVTQEDYRSAPAYSPIVSCFYEDSFLVGEDRQLKIQFNPKISSYKRQIQETKTETIGSRFPFILRNGEVNYFSFPLSGLISYKMDNESNFFNFEQPDFHEQYATYIDISDENLFYERLFREEVETFLTNGYYKCFKSPTEGIKLIAITGVSLTPETSLSRMIYSFSCTASEIGKAGLTNLLNAEIISKGEYVPPSRMGLKDVSGIIRAATSSANQDIFAAISALNINEESDYTSSVKYLQSLKVEVIPLTASQSPTCTIVITQKDGTETEIVVVDTFELDNVVDIYGLTLKSQTMRLTVQFTYSGYNEYQEKKRSVSYTEYQGLTKFYSLHKTFTTADSDDVFEAIISQEFEDSGLIIDSILGLSFLRIDVESPNGKAEFYINENLTAIGETNSLELKEKITSLRCNLGGSVASITATITVIYHARIYVS